MSQQLQNKEKCPRCGKNNLVTDGVSGEVFCQKCGFVIDEKISDNGSERIFSDSSVSKSRTGDRTSLTRHDNGLSSIINPINKDASGKPLSSSMKSSLSQLRKLDSRSTTHNSTDKNLKQALSELLKMKEKLSLSDTVSEKAAYIYRKVTTASFLILIFSFRNFSTTIFTAFRAISSDFEPVQTIFPVPKSNVAVFGFLNLNTNPGNCSG